MQLTAISKFLPCLLLQALCAQAMADDIPSLGLSLVYSENSTTCNAVTKILRDEGACRSNDSYCADNKKKSRTIHKEVVPIVDVPGPSTFGYSLSKSMTSNLSTHTVIYLRMSATHETWKIDNAALKSILALPLRPIPDAKFMQATPLSYFDLYAEEFKALLSASEKITDEWSPLLELSGQSYVVKRECDGRWVEGGFYACRRVLKLTVLQIQDESKAHPVCQFAVRKRK